MPNGNVVGFIAVILSNDIDSESKRQRNNTTITNQRTTLQEFYVVHS